jgi:hypothetical protein
MENEKKPVYVHIIKTCPGSLIVNIVNPFTHIAQRLEFVNNQKEQILPLEWAAYVYADSASGAYKMYKDGYFTFDSPELVKQEAERLGVLIGSVDFTPVSPDYSNDILKALKANDKKALDGYLLTEKGSSDVVSILNENRKDITQSVVDYIQKKLKISVDIDGGSIGD